MPHKYFGRNSLTTQQFNEIYSGPAFYDFSVLIINPTIIILKSEGNGEKSYDNSVPRRGTGGTNLERKW